MSDKQTSSQCMSTVGMLLCFKESATKTVGWHISIVSIKDNSCVQPPATFSPCFLQRGNPCSGEMEGARALF